MSSQPAFLLAALVLLVALGWLVVDRVTFLKQARRTEGRITRIHAEQTTCGVKRRSRCTFFTADVEYQPQESAQKMTVQIDAGASFGVHQQPWQGKRKEGERITVAYHPRKLSEAYEDTLWGVWATPLKVLFFQMLSLSQGLSPRRSRHYSYG